MAKSNNIDRALIFSRKIARTQWQGMRLSAWLGRFQGTKVLSNSIPKAGTNLMERALMFMPGMRMAPFRTLLDWDEISPKTARRLKRLHRGQFINAHLPSHQALLELLSENGIKTIFMIRDPRDVAISNYKYVCEIDTTHYSHRFVAELPDDDARLMAVIRGIDGAVASVSELWRRFDGWFHDPNTLVVKYEDLIGSRGGGSSQLQLERILAISMHLGHGLSETEIANIASSIYSTKASTFRKGKIGTWRNSFTDEHVALFKELTGDLLVRLGYEQSSDWGDIN